ncbi:MAG: hypothetical protein KUG79_16260 [Pseudomonadales bacterium]|nr:hypothetical protein [Pseudomonadales bacterium]
MEEVLFPTNNEEFTELLKTLKVSKIDRWVYGEFDPNRASLFLLLAEIWKGLTNPSDEPIDTKIAIYERLAVTSKSTMHQPESISIFKKWLKMGIGPVDIAKVVREGEVAGVYRAFQSLADPGMAWQERSYCLFASQNDIPAPNQQISLDSLTDLFMTAKPDDQEDMPEWA